ncbi:hypothetical protein GCM10009753_35830 [Streptantibioticus ferralitis]
MSDSAGRTPAVGVEGARQRLALAQTALLSALVASTPVPGGFDPARIRVQTVALAAKRADIVAKVAPELPVILGADYRPAFVRYARSRPLPGGYRRDALAFVASLLDDQGGPAQPPGRREELASWWAERSGPAPLRAARASRVLRRLNPRTTLRATRGRAGRTPA